MYAIAVALGPVCELWQCSRHVDSLGSSRAASLAGLCTWRWTCIETIMWRQQGEIFAAEGYAKVTGDVGVCIATSGPGATNLVTGLADALLDSVPMVAITGQV